MATIKKINAYDALNAIYEAVQDNHMNMRDEPESDGAAHDKWEEEDDALQALEDALEEAVNLFDEAVEVRKSLARITVAI